MHTVMNRASIPKEHVLFFRDMILDATSHSIAAGRSKVILRKLFVAVRSRSQVLYLPPLTPEDRFQIVSLALKVYAEKPDDWPDWLLSSIQSLSNRGASTEQLLDFLAIAAEEVQSADLLAASK